MDRDDGIEAVIIYLDVSSTQIFSAVLKNKPAREIKSCDKENIITEGRNSDLSKKTDNETYSIIIFATAASLTISS